MTSKTKKNQESAQDTGFQYYRQLIWILMKFMCNELHCLIRDYEDLLGIHPVVEPYELETVSDSRLSEYKREMVLNFTAYKQYGFELTYALELLEEKLTERSFVSGVTMQIANLIDLDKDSFDGKVVIQMYVNDSLWLEELN